MRASEMTKKEGTNRAHPTTGSFYMAECVLFSRVPHLWPLHETQICLYSVVLMPMRWRVYVCVRCLDV